MTEPQSRRSAGVSWRLLWGALTLAALLLFAIFELVALLDPAEGDTLSEGVWWVTGPVGSWRWALTAGPLGGFLAWLLVHFVWQAGSWRALLAFVAIGAAAALILPILNTTGAA